MKYLKLILGLPVISMIFLTIIVGKINYALIYFFVSQNTRRQYKEMLNQVIDCIV